MKPYTSSYIKDKLYYLGEIESKEYYNFKNKLWIPLDEVKKQGYWTEGTGKDKVVYRIDKLEYPHDEECEGTMCYCNSRRRTEEADKIINGGK